MKDSHSEAGGGIPSGELRERLTRALHKSQEKRLLSAVMGDTSILDFEAPRHEDIDAILAEIAAAGFKMVPADAIVLAPCEPEVLMPDFDPDKYDLG